MKPIAVFYNNEVLIEFDKWDSFSAWRKSIVVGCSDFYNGAVYHFRDSVNDRQWYRMDQTPILLSDVPPILRTLVLLLQ